MVLPADKLHQMDLTILVVAQAAAVAALVQALAEQADQAWLLFDI
jgi:hypothetical protein